MVEPGGVAFCNSTPVYMSMVGAREMTGLGRAVTFKDAGAAAADVRKAEAYMPSAVHSTCTARGAQ